MVGGAKRSFAGVRSQTEFGNEGKRAALCSWDRRRFNSSPVRGPETTSVRVDFSCISGGFFRASQTPRMFWEVIDMARMKGIEPHEAGWFTRLIYWVVRRKMG